MRVEWFTDESGFDRLKAEWNNLVHCGVSETLFMTWEWQTTWWRNLGSGELRIITVREEDGRLVGILPLFGDPVEGSFSLVGCADVSDYLDAIVARGYEAQVYPALVDALVRPDFPVWREVALCTLPEASPTNAELRAAADERGLSTDWHLHDVAPLIELASTWDGYLALLDKKQRHEVRRKLRRVEEAGGRWVAVQGADLTKAAVADFIELHKKSMPDKHLFMDSRMAQFFMDIARDLEFVQLEFLEFGGERAAALYNFVYNNRVLVYNSGYDPNKYANYSPGAALFALSIQQAIATGRAAYDFLRGGEEYKYRLGGQDTHVYELQISRQ